MTFSIFFFLLLFKLISTDPIIKAWKITDENRALTEIQYYDKNILNPEAIYIFARQEADRIDIVYWTGAQSKHFMNIVAAKVVGRRAKFISESNVHIIRATSKKNIKKFENLLSANVFEKTPRLYEVAGPHTIRQVQLNCGLINEENSYVLNEGLLVSVYHSSINETKRKIADSLGAYIDQVEYGKYQESSFDGESSETTLRTFCNKILNTLQADSKSKKDSISNDRMGNNKVIKKLSNTDVMISTADAFAIEVHKKEIFAHLQKYMVLTEPDSVRVDRILSTNTASGSGVPARTHKGKNSKIDKGKNRSEKTKEISFLERVFGKESPNVATTSKTTDSRDTKYENLIPIFLGSEECAPRTQPPLIDTLKSTCLYILKDLENNELFIYAGKNSNDKHLSMALSAAEIDIHENPLVQLTILLEGNTIPTHFMIHIKTEIRQLLTRE